jgi:hypothetical protein
MDCYRCGLPVEDGQDAFRYRVFKGVGGPEDEEFAARGSAEHAACISAKKRGQRLRVEAHGGDFSEVSCRVVQPDGTSVPLRDIVRSVTIRVEDGEWNVATVVFEGVEFIVDGYLDPASAPISDHA